MSISSNKPVLHPQVMPKDCEPILDRVFIPNAILDCNMLPSSVKRLGSLNILRDKVKRFLSNRSSNKETNPVFFWKSLYLGTDTVTVTSPKEQFPRTWLHVTRFGDTVPLGWLLFPYPAPGTECFQKNTG